MDTNNVESTWGIPCNSTGSCYSLSGWSAGAGQGACNTNPDRSISCGQGWPTDHLSGGWTQDNRQKHCLRWKRGSFNDWGSVWQSCTNDSVSYSPYGAPAIYVEVGHCVTGGTSGDIPNAATITYPIGMSSYTYGAAPKFTWTTNDSQAVYYDIIIHDTTKALPNIAGMQTTSGGQPYWLDPNGVTTTTCTNMSADGKYCLNDTACAALNAQGDYCIRNVNDLYGFYPGYDFKPQTRYQWTLIAKSFCKENGNATGANFFYDNPPAVNKITILNLGNTATAIAPEAYGVGQSANQICQSAFVSVANHSRDALMAVQVSSPMGGVGLSTVSLRLGENAATYQAAMNMSDLSMTSIGSLASQVSFYDIGRTKVVSTSGIGTTIMALFPLRFATEIGATMGDLQGYVVDKIGVTMPPIIYTESVIGSTQAMDMSGSWTRNSYYSMNYTFPISGYYRIYYSYATQYASAVYMFLDQAASSPPVSSAANGVSVQPTGSGLAAWSTYALTTGKGMAGMVYISAGTHKITLWGGAHMNRVIIAPNKFEAEFPDSGYNSAYAYDAGGLGYLQSVPVGTSFNYTVNIGTTGYYRVGYNVRKNNGSASIITATSTNGSTGNATVPVTGTNWTMINSVPLWFNSVGNQTLVLSTNSGSGTFDLDSLQLVQVAYPTTENRTGGWRSALRLFKVWNCQVAINGTVYNANDRTVDEIQSCQTNVYADASGVQYDSLLYNNRVGTSYPMTVSVPNYNGNIGWGSSYVATFVGLNLTLPELGMRAINLNTGATTCLGSTGKLDLTNRTVASPYANNPSIRVDMAGTRMQSSWFQVVAGGAQTNGQMINQVPAECAAATGVCTAATSISGTNGSDGLVAGAEGIRSLSGCSSDQGCTNGSPHNWSTSELPTVGEIDFNSLVNLIYYRDGIGQTINAVTSTSWNDFVAGAGAKNVVFIRDSITIGTGITTSTTDGYNVVVVDGNISIAPEVRRLDGLFMATGNISVGGTNASQLVVNGALYAGGSLNITRQFMNKSLNLTSPPTVVNYSPRLFFVLPQKMFLNLAKWKLGG